MGVTRTRVLWPGQLLPSPRQMLFLGGLGYLLLGYLSGSCVRFVGGLMLLGMAIFWDAGLAVSRFFGNLPRVVRLGLLSGGTILYYFSATMMPAQAVFLSRLCGLMISVVNSMNTGSTEIGNLIKASVNVVRALFILYLAIALIGVFNQMQRDEEWQVAARTPLIAIVIVGIVEAISALVVSGNVTTC